MSAKRQASLPLWTVLILIWGIDWAGVRYAAFFHYVCLYKTWGGLLLLAWWRKEADKSFPSKVTLKAGEGGTVKNNNFSTLELDQMHTSNWEVLYSSKLFNLGSEQFSLCFFFLFFFFQCSSHHSSSAVGAVFQLGQARKIASFPAAAGDG